jgi:hypothetical protein
MALDLGRIILVDLEEERAEPRPALKLAAFLPITIALLGIGAILVGGISAGPQTVARKAAPEAAPIDTMMTGSIKSGPSE